MSEAALKYRHPDPLRVTGGNVADNWQRFKGQWENYVLAADLTDESSEKRAAVFLTVIGTEAYDVYRTMQFEDEGDRKKIDPIMAGFEAFCIGAVNVTYERYTFNRRVQENGEWFDVFLGEVRRLARSCRFEGVDESMIRDRIVVGIRDDATRHKLLQVRDLTLKKAIDICKACEAARQQLQAMTSPDEVHHAVHTLKDAKSRGRRRDQTPPRRENDHGRDKSKSRRCKYCNRTHEIRKEACPAYGQTCRRCHKKNHFEAVCKSSKSAGQKYHKPEVCQLAIDDDELLTQDDPGADRWYARMEVDGKPCQFLLDCGATCNLLPESLVRSLGRLNDVRPATATLRMFDHSALKTTGIISAEVKNPKTKQSYVLDFYVATKHEQPLLGFKTCRDLDLLKVVDQNVCEVRTAHSITSCTTEAEVIAEYPDLFTGLGCFEGEVHLEVDPSVSPVQMPLRRLPLGIRDKVIAELQQLERDGVIARVPEPTSWVSPLLVVTKSDNSIRLCLDPKNLNKALKRAHFFMPTVDDILPKLASVKVFSTADAKQAFWHCRLDEESSRLTTFDSPLGRMRWLRLPYGVSPAPEVFAARLQAALEGLQGIHVIADDILITGAGNTVEEATADHNNNLKAFLQRCREKGIKLNQRKLQLNRDSIVFCGHELTRDGIRPDSRKVEAIINMPAPTDKQGVMRLLGMATYLARFCPGFSEVTAPLRELLRADNAFCWRPAVHGVAFDKLKQMLTEAPVLAYFDATKPTVVQADSSQGGLAAVLMSGGRPVAYASRCMTRAEQSYAQIEKECCAILFALERFHTFVSHRDLVVETDHKPLISIAKKALSSAPKRLQRMLLRLQRYSFTLVYRPGSTLLCADTLSRAYPPDDSTNGLGFAFDEEIAELNDEQMQELRLVASERTIGIMQAAAAGDEDYQSLRAQVTRGWPETASELPPELRQYFTFADEIVVSGGLMFKGNRVIVPLSARDLMLQRIHSSHIGVNACIRRARESVFLPGITADIKKLVSSCHVCAKLQGELQKEPMRPYPAPSRVWERVGTDIFSHRGQDYLVTVCFLSGYFEVDRLAGKTARDVIYALRQQFARHGIPNEVVSDNQPFGADEFKKFATDWEFIHTTSSPRYSQGNGRAERAVQTAKRLMEKASESHSDPLLALLDWRNTPSETLQLSAAQLMFGRRTRTRLPAAEALLKTPAATTAQSALTEAKRKQAQYYDRSARPVERPIIPVGQTVRFRYDEGDWRKGEISQILPHRSYEVKQEDGSIRRRTSKHVRFSNEAKIIVPANVDENDTATLPTPSPSRSPPANAMITQSGSAPRPAIDSRAPPTHGTGTPVTVTRSGREVHKPARYR